MRRDPTILVADDDELLRELLVFKLSGRGYSVLTAEDGESALQIARQFIPQLVVLDAMMPVRNGFDVLREIKADPSTSGVPVIMLTARKLESDIVSALDLGASDYLVKPFNPQELLARISRHLTAARAA